MNGPIDYITDGHGQFSSTTARHSSVPHKSKGTSSSIIRHSQGKGEGKSRKDAKPCHDEAQKIIDYLQKKYNYHHLPYGSSADDGHQTILTKCKNLQKEILSVCRRIKRANRSSKSLLDVLNNEDESICLVIKRNQDGRIQVDGRKVWPHAFMFHLYALFIKGDNTREQCGNHSELRTKENLKTPCSYPFAAEWANGENLLCINPFHYEEKLKIEVNSLVKRTPLTKGPPSRPSTASSVRTEASGNSLMIDSNCLEKLSLSKNLWEVPNRRERKFGDDELKNAKGIIKFEETVSKAHEKRNMHNTRSRSPRQGRRNPSCVTDCELIKLSLQPVNTVNEVKSQLEDFSFMENAFNDVQVGDVGDVAGLQQIEDQLGLQPTNANQNGSHDNSEYSMVTHPIVLREAAEKPWCNVSVYECNNKIEVYSTAKTQLGVEYKAADVNRYAKKETLKGKDAAQTDIFDLSSISNVNRSTDTWDLLEKLQRGLTLVYDREKRIVSCHNNCKNLKIYVLSYLMNVECGKHEQSLIQVGPGASRVVYDGYQLAKTIEGVNSTTQNDLQKWALISQYANYFTVFRISFQPWGPEYTKKRLTDCDLWLEIFMREYLDWINQIEHHYEYVVHDAAYDSPETTPQYDQIQNYAPVQSPDPTLQPVQSPMSQHPMSPYNMAMSPNNLPLQ